MNKQFPYGVRYKRTRTWWSPGGDWYKISNWLSKTIGRSGIDWDFIDEHFVFNQEIHRTLFLLRWS